MASGRANSRPAPRGLPLVGAAGLITGASGGIGAATARRLSATGVRLALHGRDRAKLDALAGELAGTALVLDADLADPGAAEDLVSRAEARLGPLDVVVDSAGIGWAGAFVAMDLARADSLVAVNLVSPIHLARASLPGMVERGRGALVLVGSIAGHLGVRQEAVYSATKAALVGLAEALRAEVAPAGVGVSLVSPGVVSTQFFERRGRPYGRKLPRPIRPERVAEAIEEAIVKGLPRVIVPSWLGLPVALAALVPGPYRRLSDRWG